MQLEWDPQKADQNLRLHGISFLEAASVFFDPLSITFDDWEHSVSEQRWITVGASLLGTVLVIAHTDRGDRIRIISARKATRRERRIYEEG